ncbi:SDR family oxidoreductase [Taibaiella soli]|uniref:Neomenthol dehydrogenase n=1 Tax=Taibaiella soli TaxID=1649169 RepID=A0A2W2A9C8_9BACT|nr:SDR family oxidoreductase [Taibaiella soli]PZF71871.1 neomenthol dehydrogenase [Taibaiella soli]
MKTVLITGANKGIGFETARQMAALGYFVYIGCRDLSKGLEAVRQLNATGLANIDCIQIDTTDISSVQAARRILDSKSGRLDILINNAGIAGDQPQHISTGSIDNLRNVFETNFFGAVQTTTAFIDLLRQSPEPRIVNVSSQLASLSFHTNSQNPNHRIYDAYSCSKTALNAFTVMLAKEYADTNFKINSVEPGYTATDLNGFKGLQTPAQAAEVIVKYATIDDAGATGKYFNKEGEMAW